MKKEVSEYPGLTGTFELKSDYVGPHEDGFAGRVLTDRSL
ncbi:hypothetical protein F4694_003876 [Bacillus niacini]|uniref:Uncharacterized protein n=1 Tax=Neobacillus niacini TaxID=86668 RepID=A0A852TFW3_9BACI|nr:hypothetical protein [Neobacillus niacini]